VSGEFSGLTREKDALSASLFAARKIGFCRLERLTGDQDYVEMQYLVSDVEEEEKESAAGAFLFATLAPSACKDVNDR
jgi:hypothetical protein